MEFELDRTQLDGFDVLLDTTLLKEETMEMIVPDACPDILRIVETDGQVLLGRRTMDNGRVEVSGSFQLTVLYLPDGESGTRHLDVTIPFTCVQDGQDIGPDCIGQASVRLCRADTRAVNPRKILVRGEAAVDLTIFSPHQLSLGSCAACEAGPVEQLAEEQNICLTACVEEKAFACTDEVNLPSSRPAAVELLKSRIGLGQPEWKIIGSKLIFKGGIRVWMLYRGEDDGIYSCTSELPYSQIMEVSGVGEDAEADLLLTLTGAQCTISPTGEGRTAEVEIEVLAQAVVRETRRVTVLADAYSIRGDLGVEWTSYPVEERLDRGARSQSVREVWESVSAVRDVLDGHLALGKVVQRQEGERRVFTAQLNVQLLCAGEDGALFTEEHPMEVPCILEVPENCHCFCQCGQSGEIYTAPSTSGIEIRFDLEFRYFAFVPHQLTAVSALCQAEPAERGDDQPSLVLRMLERGERLWDVAKTYRTTVAEIMGANELEEEGAASGKLLLIPRKR